MLQTSMGEINLLQGGFTGKVGAVVGEKLHGKYRIQSEIFGKAPLTDKQKIALYNMTYINRFASVLSKAGFSPDGYHKKNIHNHNAIAQDLFYCTYKGEANFEAMQTWHDLPNCFDILQPIANPMDETVEYRLKPQANWKYPIAESCTILLFTDTGRILNIENNIPVNTFVTSRAVFEQHENIKICAIYAERKNGKLFYRNFSFNTAVNMQYALCTPTFPATLTSGYNFVTFDEAGITNLDIVEPNPSGLQLKRAGLYLITGAYMLTNKQLGALDRFHLSQRTTSNAISCEIVDYAVQQNAPTFKPQTLQVFFPEGGNNYIIQQSTWIGNDLGTYFQFGVSPLKIIYMGI